MPSAIILSYPMMDAVCNMPHRMVCSPIRSDFTSATNEEASTPARLPPVAEASALAVSKPLPSGSFSGCTAIRVGTPNPRLYSSRTSVPGHFGAHITTVISGRTS